MFFPDSIEMKTSFFPSGDTARRGPAPFSVGDETYIAAIRVHDENLVAAIATIGSVVGILCHIYDRSDGSVLWLSQVASSLNP